MWVGISNRYSTSLTFSIVKCFLDMDRYLWQLSANQRSNVHRDNSNRNYKEEELGNGEGRGGGGRGRTEGVNEGLVFGGRKDASYWPGGEGAEESRWYQGERFIQVPAP